MCVIYRGCSAHRACSSPALTECLCVCVEVVTSVLFSDVPSLVVLRLCPQIFLCLLHVFSPLLLLSDSLSLSMNKDIELRGGHYLLNHSLNLAPL